MEECTLDDGNILHKWEPACLGSEVLGYIEECLQDIAAYSAMEGDKTEYCNAFPILPSSIVDMTTATPIWADCDPMSPMDVPLTEEAILVASNGLTEAKLAQRHLNVEYALPAWSEHADKADTPRHKRQQAASATHAHPHVEQTQTPQDRGYKERKKRGKPIDKRPTKKLIVEQSQLKIVITGPDFVGCTTLLQILK